VDSLADVALQVESNSVSGVGRAVCPNCGEPLVGRFCHSCGAKTVERDELTLKSFAGEFVHELVDLEHSKVFQTLAALLFKPGFLSAEYFAGRKSRYLSPLRLFLLFFALSFFAYTVYKPVSVYDLGHIVELDTTGQLAPSLNRLAAHKRMEVNEFIERVNEVWQNYLSLTPILIAVLLAAVLKIFYLPTGRYFVEHFVFSLHYSSFSLLLTLIMWPVYFFIGLKAEGIYWVIFFLTVLTWVTYLFFALKTFYRQRTGEALLMSFIVCAVYYGINIAFVALTFTVALGRIILS
jgi:hypothetical protein